MSIPAVLKGTAELTVLHATDKVINLVTEDDQLISLVTQSIGNGPHNIVLPLGSFARIPSFGQKALLREDRLRLNGLDVQIGEAELWQAEPDWPRLRRHHQRVQRSTPAMKAALRAGTPDPGVLLLLDPEKTARRNLPGYFAEAMVEPAGQLTTGLAQAGFEQAVRAARRLAGMGTGLTPAGDDFLSGCMLACFSGFCPSEMRAQLPDLAVEAAQRTTRLSAAYLHSAARGQFGAIWHELINAVLEQSDLELGGTLEVIMGIGHNSGAYTLSGFTKLVDAFSGKTKI